MAAQVALKRQQAAEDVVALGLRARLEGSLPVLKPGPLWGPGTVSPPPEEDDLDGETCAEAEEERRDLSSGHSEESFRNHVGDGGPTERDQGLQRGSAVGFELPADRFANDDDDDDGVSNNNSNNNNDDNNNNNHHNSNMLKVDGFGQDKFRCYASMTQDGNDSDDSIDVCGECELLLLL